MKGKRDDVTNVRGKADATDVKGNVDVTHVQGGGDVTHVTGNGVDATNVEGSRAVWFYQSLWSVEKGIEKAEDAFKRFMTVPD